MDDALIMAIYVVIDHTMKTLEMLRSATNDTRQRQVRALSITGALSAVS